VKYLTLVIVLGLTALMMTGGANGFAHGRRPQAPIYSFRVTDIDGDVVPLSNYKGDVLIIVNTASLCGNTPQYAALETLYKTYSGQGLRILAFPADNFANQEPGGNAQIKQFCTAKYEVTFDLFSKISVAGPDQAPLYTYLTNKTTDPSFGGPIEWNFAKFLINRKGEIVNRFPAGHSPASPDVVAAIQAELAKPS
jgi:glutathione peroxidase